MKTAKEWAKQIDRLPLLSYDDAKREGSKLNFVKAIQLDAWKQGMSDAAKIAQTTHEEWMQAYYKVAPLPTITIMDAILHARDERKTI